MSLDEIRIAGLKALERELGPVGMARFLQQYELGKGDYTKERKNLLEKYPEIGKIVEEIEEMKKDE